MASLPKILCVGAEPTAVEALAKSLGAGVECHAVPNHLEAEKLLRTEEFSAVMMLNQDEAGTQPLETIRAAEIVSQIADGVVLVDADNALVWANHQFRQWCPTSDIIGESFYKALGSADILGPDFCPFSSARRSGVPSTTVVRISDHQFYQLKAVPLSSVDHAEPQLIVSIRDVTEDSMQRQKLDRIREAGMELADIKPSEIYEMTVDERIELLKTNILHYTHDLLHFDVVEIRLLDHKTNLLEPLLAVGIGDEAANRVLTAEPHRNGVTGFVASTGKSYLCEDTAKDPLYLDGLIGAKSSLTVPLILHDDVIGSFNVESPDVNAFTESDLQMVEQFARDLAMAINTLELLIAQQADTARQSVDAIHSAVALPIDEILNDTVNVMEHYIGHDPDVVRRLQAILRHARDIKQVIQEIGREMAPAKAAPIEDVEARPLLKDRRILVVDADKAVRDDAHRLLERYGCVVETAHEGSEAVLMVRNCGENASYDAVISDIRLPDFSGYQLLLRLQPLMTQVPMVLMTGFGYDPGHSIVKARQAGLPAYAILYKPFRLDQLIEVVEKIIQSNEVHAPTSS